MGATSEAAQLLRVTVKPRIQKDKWSLYWKESMETKTELLDAVELELGAAATVTDLHAALQARLGWEAPERLERLEGFTEPWMVAVFKGRDMPPSQTLAECGLGATAEVVVVRRVLVPETWKILTEGEEDSGDSSEDEW